MNKSSAESKIILKKQAVDKLREELKGFDSLDELEAQIRDCLIKQIWTEVIAVEDELVRLNADKDEQQETISKLYEKHEKLNGKIIDLGNIDELQVELENVQTEQTEMGNALSELHKDFLQKKKVLDAHLSDERELKNSVSDHYNRLESVQKQVQFSKICHVMN